MEANLESQWRAAQVEMARKATELADEVKLLAVNLAITLAQVQSHEKSLRDLEPQFSELIKKASETAHQAGAALQVFQNQKARFASFPETAQEEDQIHTYLQLERSLQQVLDSSEKVVQAISLVKSRQQVG